MLRIRMVSVCCACVTEVSADPLSWATDAHKNELKHFE